MKINNKNLFVLFVAVLFVVTPSVVAAQINVPPPTINPSAPYTNRDDCIRAEKSSEECNVAFPPNNGITTPIPAGSNEIRCNGDYEMIGGVCVPKSNGSGGLTSKKTLGEVMLYVIRALLTLGGVIAVLFIIIGGFQYITSSGNDEAAEKGKKTLINAVIGLVIIIMSFVIVSVITNLVTRPTVI
jgi:hypothetical protein